MYSSTFKFEYPNAPIGCALINFLLSTLISYFSLNCSTICFVETLPNVLPSLPDFKTNSNVIPSIFSFSASAFFLFSISCNLASSFCCSKIFLAPAVSLTANLFLIKKFCPYPSDTLTTSPFLPTFLTSSNKTTFIFFTLFHPNIDQ